MNSSLSSAVHGVVMGSLYNPIWLKNGNARM